MSSLNLPSLGLGGVAIGNGFQSLSDQRAEETLEAAWEAGIRYYDTSPWYGLGLSERRFGRFLRNQDRNDYLLSTKVGRVLTATDTPPETMWVNPSPFDYRYDYSAGAVRRSLEDSLQRLGVERIDYVFIHDLSPDHDDEYGEGTTWEDHFEVALDGAMPELTRMRDEGLIKGWGLGVNTIDPILRTLEAGHSADLFLSAIQYTLLDHQDSLNRLFPAIEESGAGLIVAAPFNSGLLAGQDHYNYGLETTREQRTRLGRIHELADNMGVDMVDACIQFSFAPKVVDTVLFGASKPEQVRASAAALDRKVPKEFWKVIRDEGLIDNRAPVPGD
ncbi:aldo/keto reductase [Microbulbifer yueqingensis]|uniref:D-threo-aldose 1-dehydrogenase n=1 Tax=Microbulbifer yueqingensis TaxID=658219 RepID=A0A1G8USX9_9GAMM|nr:aldo/keto reductase [Microbulbifer yueqingensis]SDJ56908.1 D-threo-aldose 1-dehydrogenase [Microbulbifer yueqingensis]